MVSRLSQGRLRLFPAPKAAKVELPAPFVAVENIGRNTAWLLPPWCQQVVENLSRRWVKAPPSTTETVVGSIQGGRSKKALLLEAISRIKHFRYLTWRNPHLYKLYVRVRYLKLLLTIPHIFLELGSEDVCDVFSFSEWFGADIKKKSQLEERVTLIPYLILMFGWVAKIDWNLLMMCSIKCIDKDLYRISPHIVYVKIWIPGALGSFWKCVFSEVPCTMIEYETNLYLDTPTYN